MALLKDLTVFGTTNLIGDTFVNNIYGNGFHHNAHNTDTYFLLAGGGAKALSTIATSSHNHNNSTAKNAWGQRYVDASGVLSDISGDISNAGNITPSATNSKTLGTSSLRWSNLYIGTKDTYGSATQGIYWNGGVPTPCTVSINSGTKDKLAYYSSNTTISSYTNTVGGTTKPIYLNGGVPTALTGNRGGPSVPVYLENGEIKRCSATVGANNKPIWMNAGEIVESASTIGSGVQFSYLNDGTIEPTTSTVGSSSKPVYLNNGVITECSEIATSSHTHKIKLGGTEITIPTSGVTPTAVTEISGPFAINTEANSSKAFSIQRGSSSEGVQHWVDDSEYHIDYTNDKKSSSIHWRIINTDTENPSTPPQTSDFSLYLTHAGYFHPEINNTGSIGTSSRKWNAIYGTNIYGDLTGNVTGNADTATKLKTARNLWGQSFDGSADVNGNIFIDTADTDKYIHFRYNTNNYAGASWRLISRGSGSGDTNYFDIETGGSGASNNTWYRVIRLTMDNRYVGIGTDAPSSKLHVSGGLLKITNNSNTVTIGSANSSLCHFDNSANIPFYFGKTVHVNGDIRLYNGNGYLLSTGQMWAKGYHYIGNDNNDYVLTAGGSYKLWTETVVGETLVARNSDGDIHGHYFNTDISVDTTSTIGVVFVGRSDDGYIRKVSIDRFSDIIKDNDLISIEKTLTVTEAWMNTGITTESGEGKNFPNGDGTYIIQISHDDLGNDGKKSIYSGLISIFDGTNGTETEEIILHHASVGPPTKRLYIRVQQVTNGSSQGHAQIQIAASSNWGSSHKLTFKFRKMI